MDITPIIEAIIGLCAAIVTCAVIPWVKAQAQSKGLSDWLAWVDIAVKAAEQLYASTQGEAKKQYVVQFLENQGYTVDEEEIDNAVEAAVLELHNELYGSEKDA